MIRTDYDLIMARWCIALVFCVLCAMIAACERAPTAPAAKTSVTPEPAADIATALDLDDPEQCDPAALAPRQVAPGEVRGAFNFESIERTYMFVCETEPDPVRLNELFSMHIRVWYLDGRPIANPISIDADAAMPQHGHGMMVRPKVTAKDDNWFLVEGMMLHMPGVWRLSIDVTEGAVTERASFELEVH